MAASPDLLWQRLADLVLAIHAGYVLFVVGGQVLIMVGWIRSWAWTRRMTFRLLHLAAIGLVMLEAWLGVRCPLTVLENLLRLKAGLMAYETSFIGRWLQWMIFYSASAWVFTLVYTVFTALVIVTWLAYPPRKKLK